MNHPSYGNAEAHVHRHLFPRYDTLPDHCNKPLSPRRRVRGPQKSKPALIVGAPLAAPFTLLSLCPPALLKEGRGKQRPYPDPSEPRRGGVPPPS